MKLSELSISMIIVSCVLGVSFIVGCTILTKHEPQRTEQAALLTQSDKGLLDIKEAAEYLNLSEEQIMLIITTEQKQFQAARSFSGTMFPFFKIGSDIYTSKNELEIWISDITSNNRRYVDGYIY